MEEEIKGSKRTNLTLDRGVDKKSRCESRVWTPAEEIAIADYISANPYLGKNKAKETLANYLKKLIASVKLSKCSDRQLNNKYNSMKQKYEETFKWINETGQGVKDDDPAGFEDIVKKKCSYFYVLNEVWGTSQAVNSSYQRDSGHVQFGLSSSNSENQTDLDEDANFDSTTYDHESYCFIEQDDIEIESSAKRDRLSHETLKSSTHKFEAALKKESNRPKLSGSDKISTFMDSRQEKKDLIEQKKLDWEKEKWELEKVEVQRKDELFKDLELQKAEINKVVELQKSQNSKEVEFKRLELEEKKLNFKIRKFNAKNP